MSSTGPRPADDAGPDAPTPPESRLEPDTRADPVTALRSDDDRDVGWGDDLGADRSGERDARWYEEQRPPHWE